MERRIVPNAGGAAGAVPHGRAALPGGLGPSFIASVGLHIVLVLAMGLSGLAVRRPADDRVIIVGEATMVPFPQAMPSGADSAAPPADAGVPVTPPVPAAPSAPLAPPQPKAMPATAAAPSVKADATTPTVPASPPRDTSWRDRVSRFISTPSGQPAAPPGPSMPPPASPPSPSAMPSQPMAPSRPGTVLPGGPRPGTMLSPQAARYIAMVDTLFRSHWSLPEDLHHALAGFSCEIAIKIDAEGYVKRVDVVRPSGNRTFDAYARDAASKAVRLPLPPKELLDMSKGDDTIVLVFRPRPKP